MPESLADILIRCLNEIDEIGGEERHLLAQTIGRDVYDKLISKPRTENLIHRWLNATGRAKKPATKALAIAIARLEDTPEKVSRLENELGDAFEIDLRAPARGSGQERVPTSKEVKNHAAAQHQRRAGQRVGYEKPKRVSVTILAELARHGDASRYIRERRKG